MAKRSREQAGVESSQQDDGLGAKRLTKQVTPPPPPPITTTFVWRGCSLPSVPLAEPAEAAPWRRAMQMLPHVCQLEQKRRPAVLRMSQQIISSRMRQRQDLCHIGVEAFQTGGWSALLWANPWAITYL